MKWIFARIGCGSVADNEESLSSENSGTDAYRSKRIANQELFKWVLTISLPTLSQILFTTLVSALILITHRDFKNKEGVNIHC